MSLKIDPRRDGVWDRGQSASVDRFGDKSVFGGRLLVKVCSQYVEGSRRRELFWESCVREVFVTVRQLLVLVSSGPEWCIGVSLIAVR